MKIYHPITRQEGEDLVLDYWDSPMPIKPHPNDAFIGNDFTQDKRSAMAYSFNEAMARYCLAKNDWKESKKTVKFHPDSKMEINAFIIENGTFEKLITTGISLESIVNRIGFKIDCLKVCDGECIDCEHLEKFAVLLPLVEDESQEEKIREKLYVKMLDILYTSEGHSDSCFRFMKFLKDNYIITRK